MRIATRLALSSYISLGVLSLFIPVLIWLFTLYGLSIRQNLLADQIVAAIFERTVLRDQYLIYGAERIKQQWLNKTAVLESLLDLANERFKEKGERDALIRIRNSFNATRGTFLQIVKLKEESKSGAGNDELEQRLISQNILLASALYSEAAQLDELTGKVANSNYNKTVLLSSIFVAVLVLTTVLNSMLVNRLLRRRLASIQAGIAIIAEGDLEHRIPCRGDDELAELSLMLNTMTDKVRMYMNRLEAANNELEAFSYSISHDLRAPLRHVNGFIELLREEDTSSLNETSRRYLQVIADAAKKMGTLIDDLLSFSRMGRTEMMQTSVSMWKLVADARNELQNEMEGKTIIWETDNLAEVYGDPAMLRQVLVNLMGNALKYSRDRNPIRITISCRQSITSDETICSVADNGVGFDMRYLDKLFGLFQRLHTVEEFEGTGVGLANVRRIIQRHGGRTWAEGAVNEGATFYFSLPNRGEQT